jgi:hypothetical protein
MGDLKTFMSLTDSEVAKEITAILETNKVPFFLQDTSKDFDVTFANNDAKNAFLIMLHPSDFEKASTVLEQQTPLDYNNIDPQHPLLSFSIDELKDVVKNFDEWHPIDVKLAKHLLSQQNIVVETTEIKKQQTLKELESLKPEKSSYTFCLMGGFAGIGIALFLMTAKRTLPDGTKKYIYTNSDRRHGFYMLLAGAILFIITLLYFEFESYGL